MSAKVRSTAGHRAPSRAGGTSGDQPSDGRAARRVGTREAILASAVDLMAERGFTATSVEDIAEAAGVAKGSVYYNFEGKAQILEAAMSTGLERLEQAVLDVRATGHGHEALTGLVAALLRLVSEHPRLAKLMASEVFRVDREWRDPVGRVRERIIHAFDEVLHEVRPGQDVSVLAAAVFGAVLLAGLEWLVFQPERSFEEVRDSVLVLVGGV